MAIATGVLVLALVLSRLSSLSDKPDTGTANMNSSSTSIGINSNLSGSVGIAPNKPNDTILKIGDTVAPTNLKVLGSLSISDINVDELFSLTNQHRQTGGISAVRLNTRLNSSATNKCNDMVEKNYWSHNAPDGTSPWHFFTEAGVRYTKAGENQSVGFTDAASVVEGWMKSPAHRDNILDPSYTDVGFAVCKSDNYVEAHGQTALIVVQHFARL